MVQLNKADIRHFREYGYLVKRDVIDYRTLAELTAEVDAALCDAFNTRTPDDLDLYLKSLREQVQGAVLGQYLPMMSERTPVSFELAQSEVLSRIAQDLLECDQIIAKPAKGIRFLEPSGWHPDQWSNFKAVKIGFYLQSSEPVGFEVLPFSHCEPVKAHAGAILARPGAEGLVHRLELGPDSALIFDNRLWHRNVARNFRTQWSVTFMSEPTHPDEVEEAARNLGGFFGKHPTYDDKKYPFMPTSWLEGTSDRPLAQNLHRSGVREKFVREFGSFISC